MKNFLIILSIFFSLILFASNIYASNEDNVAGVVIENGTARPLNSAELDEYEKKEYKKYLKTKNKQDINDDSSREDNFSSNVKLELPMQDRDILYVILIMVLGILIILKSKK